MEEFEDLDRVYPICSNCGEDENFNFLYSRATTDWYECKNCGEQTQVRNVNKY